MVKRFFRVEACCLRSKDKKSGLTGPGTTCRSSCRGRLAQLVEHCLHTAGATGSSPVPSTIISIFQWKFRNLFFICCLGVGLHPRKEHPAKGNVSKEFSCPLPEKYMDPQAVAFEIPQFLHPALGTFYFSVKDSGYPVTPHKTKPFGYFLFPRKQRVAQGPYWGKRALRDGLIRSSRTTTYFGYPSGWCFYPHQFAQIAAKFICRLKRQPSMFEARGLTRV